MFESCKSAKRAQPRHLLDPGDVIVIDPKDTMVRYSASKKVQYVDEVRHGQKSIALCASDAAVSWPPKWPPDGPINGG